MKSYAPVELERPGVPAGDGYRGWPVPARRWAMAMSWHGVLFAHWPVPVEAVRRVVPEPLMIDTFDGRAWVGVVPFAMTGVRPRLSPTLPWVSALLELNVRTYVKDRDGPGAKPGVYFMSLDAANPLAVAVARKAFGLPYYRAEMSLREEDGWIDYTSERTHRGAAAARFAGRYRPDGDVARAKAGSIEHWLVERYCLYTADGRDRAWRCEIDHPPWPLQPAEATIECNTMASAGGIELPDEPPLCHYAERLNVVAWTLDRVLTSPPGRGRPAEPTG
jgi:uncharacterized protein